MPTLPPLGAPLVIRMTTCCATDGDKVGIMSNPRFWMQCHAKYMFFVPVWFSNWWLGAAYDSVLWDIFQHHDDVIKWKYFPRYWPFVRGIHRSAVNSPHKGQWHGALTFSLIYVWINGWVNNRKAGDLRCYRAHCDATVMTVNLLSKC